MSASASVTSTGLNAIQIQALVREMDTSIRRHKGLKRTNMNLYRQKLEEENKLLYESFPTIYEMHFEGKLDATFFEMLKLRQKIEKGEMTEDYASRVIGQKLFDKYVTPKINPTTAANLIAPTLSYEDYYKQWNHSSHQ